MAYSSLCNLYVGTRQTIHTETDLSPTKIQFSYKVFVMYMKAFTSAAHILYKSKVTLEGVHVLKAYKTNMCCFFSSTFGRKL